jgi:hypothetical protein
MGQWTRTGAADELAKVAPLEPESKSLLRPTYSPKQFVDELTAAGHHPDAIRLMAFLLPRREAVWWAATCLRAVPKLSEPPFDVAIKAAEKWAADPSDENRRASFNAGQTVEFAHPSGLAAVAAFWSEGSLSAPDLPVVAPAPHLCPTAVANAILLAAVIDEPERAPEKYTIFLALSLEVLSGKNRWKDSASARAAAPTATPGPVPGKPAAPATQPPKPKSWY